MLSLHEGQHDFAPGRRKALVLLAYLARRSPRPVTRAALVELLWPDRDEAHARQSLRQALLELRRAVGPGLIAEKETVTLLPGTLELDVSEFELALDRSDMSSALAQWRGEFLAGCDDLGGSALFAWLESEREGLRRRLSEAFARATTIALQAADSDNAALMIGKWTELLPLDERANVRRIEFLMRSGRHQEARSAYDEFCSRLRRELDVDPSPETVRIGAQLHHAFESARLPSPLGSAALFTPDLVGRDAPLAELERAWSEIEEKGDAIIIEGDEGTGKTFLVEHFLRRLTDQKREFLQLASPGQVEEARSFGLVAELLRPLVNIPELAGVSEETLTDLTSILPALRARFKNLSESRGVTDNPPDPHIIGRAARAALEAIAEELPVVVFIDGMQHSDSESVLALEDIVQHVPRGVFLIVTSAPREPRTEGGRDIGGIRGVRRIPLGPLKAPALERMLESMVALRPVDRKLLAERLQAETGGNPRLCAEIVGALVDEGMLVSDERGIWSLGERFAAEEMPLPTSIRDTLKRRVAHLGQPARRMLDALSNLPEPARFSALVASSGLSGAEAEAAVDELVTRRIVRIESRGGNVVFTQAGTRRVLRERSAPRGFGSSVLTRIARRPRLTLAGALALLAAVVWAGAVGVMGVQNAPTKPLIAVGGLAEHDLADTSGLATTLTDMLATNLARVPGMHVVSGTRMHEIMSQLPVSRDERAQWTAAARRAGARELLDGSLLKRPDGTLQLDLRRINLDDGSVEESYTVRGNDPFKLVDQVTTQIALAFRASASGFRVADVTTSSLVAFRFYEEGLRSFYRGDYREAIRLFGAAESEDTTFAMASYYAWLSRGEMGTSTSPEDLRRLMRVAAHATDRERLFIQGSVAAAFSEPRQLAIAETLSVRYPAEPDGHFLRGSALVWSGDFLGAIPWLRRVVAMDSVGLTRAGLRCRACDAFEGIVNAYLLADSAGAAERTARQWIRQQPMAGRAWTILSQTLELQGRYREAIAVRHHAATLNPVDDYDAVHPAMIRIRAGDFTGADRLLGELARDGTPAVQSLALWFQLISLRNQGRLRAAMAILDKGPRPAPGSSEFVPLTEMRMQVLLEMGRPRDAAALVEPLARTDKSGVLSGIEARRRAWNLTHLATALMAARDTGRIPSLADTLELLGKASAFGRDGLLHHYVRGLLLEARQHPESAAVELRRAIYSPTIGYTRVNYELGKLLIRLRRPREAIATLQPSLRGGLEASNLYVTRSDLHELLGQAWEQERRGDSATVHYSAAANAWSNADASFHARRAMILDRLARLERGGSIR